MLLLSWVLLLYFLLVLMLVLLMCSLLAGLAVVQVLRTGQRETVSNCLLRVLC
jgi:hypothetical protein